MATGDNPHGSVRITNVQGTSGGKDTANTDPLGVEMAFDGQNYFIGPNDRMVIPTAGMANASAAVNVDIDNTTATKKFPNTAPFDA